jgi:hypothetical protein
VNDILGSDDDITKFEYTKKVHRSEGPVLIGILLKNKDDIEGLLSRLEKIRSALHFGERKFQAVFFLDLISTNFIQ